MPCLSFLDHCTMLSHCIWSKTYKIGLPRWHQWQRTHLSKQEVRDTGSIPGLGRSPEGEYATCSSIHAWRIPWTEESGGLWSLGSQRVGHRLERLSTHAPPHWVLRAWTPAFSPLPAQTLWPDWPSCLPLRNQALSLSPLLAPSQPSHLSASSTSLTKLS